MNTACVHDTHKVVLDGVDARQLLAHGGADAHDEHAAHGGGARENTAPAALRHHCCLGVLRLLRDRYTWRVSQLWYYHGTSTTLGLSVLRRSLILQRVNLFTQACAPQSLELRLRCMYPVNKLAEVRRPRRRAYHGG